MPSSPESAAAALATIASSSLAFAPAQTSTPASMAPSSSNASSVVFLTPPERIGVIVMAVAGVLSFSLVSVLLLYIVFTAFSEWRNENKHLDRAVSFTSKQIAVFITCLLVSDLIQSASGITQVKWAVDNSISEGPLCTFQAAAATLVIGDLGSTVWSCVIAAHTFSVIALGKHWSRRAVRTTVVSGWTVLTMITFIAPLTLAKTENGPFFSIAGTWCFISSQYAISRLVIHYVPLFVAAALILSLYGLIFLFLRGSISFAHFGDAPSSRDTDRHMNAILVKQRIAIAKRMLWYPAAYLTCIMPIAITRLIGFQKQDISEPVWICGMTFLFSLGAVDAVIYATTRKVIKPINLPFNMVTLGDTHSSSLHFSLSSPWRDNSSRKGFWGGSPEEIEKCERINMELEQGNVLDRELREAKAGRWPRGGKEPDLIVPQGGIHVTLERIQEVI